MTNENFPELRPCPFCGGTAIMQTFITAREEVPRFRVRCADCWCMMDWDDFTPESAAEKWNRRTNDVKAVD